MNKARFLAPLGMTAILPITRSPDLPATSCLRQQWRYLCRYGTPSGEILLDAQRCQLLLVGLSVIFQRNFGGGRLEFMGQEIGDVDSRDRVEVFDAALDSGRGEERQPPPRYTAIPTTPGDTLQFRRD